MSNLERDKIFEKLGWTVVCESPYEIQHEDGSFATLNAAYILEKELLENWRSYLENDEEER